MIFFTGMWDGSLVTGTAPVADRYGWTTFTAMVWKHTSHSVDETGGAVTGVHTMTTSPSHASQVSLPPPWRLCF